MFKRRFKSSYGEIDLIAMDGEVLVIVEVKYRSKNYYLPEETVDKRKINCVYLAAEDYLYKNDLKDQMLRFDIIVIDYNGLRHFENAF